jgi:hypothetical protein
MRLPPDLRGPLPRLAYREPPDDDEFEEDEDEEEDDGYEEPPPDEEVRPNFPSSNSTPARAGASKAAGSW